MQYADFTYYSETFGGDLIPQRLFARYELKARSFIDNITFGNITAPCDDKVKTAVCEMCEAFYCDDEKKNIHSEEHDGYGIVYSDEDLEEKLGRIAEIYLAATGYLYGGIY